MAAASPTRNILPDSRLTQSTSPHEVPGASQSKTPFAWPPTNPEFHEPSATASTSKGNKVSSDSRADQSRTNPEGDDNSRGQRHSTQGHAISSENPQEANGSASYRSSAETRSRDPGMHDLSSSGNERIEGADSAAHPSTNAADDVEGDSTGREGSSRSRRSHEESPARRLPLLTTAHASNTPDKMTKESKLQSPAKSQPATEPRMCLVTFPTHELITLVASLLQRIAAANDKLRRDRAKEPANTPKASISSSSPSPSAVSDTGRQRGSYERPDPAAMVIPPYRSKSSASTPQVSPKEATPLRDDSMRESPPPTKTLRRNTAVTTSSTSASRSQSSDHRQEGKAEDVAEVALLDARPPSKWPTTTAAEHAVSHPSSLLCFHARNVPSIGVETYLQRILKYCPVTNDVFISLLVYFDRMSRKLANQSSELGRSEPNDTNPPGAVPKGFAIDSYNVHRLVIAGITISSKFHSDVFYTNSRYAKVRTLCRRDQHMCTALICRLGSWIRLAASLKRN
jgi:hypothetical protein